MTQKEWAAAVKQRDGHKCKVCGEKRSRLQAHHIVPVFADKRYEFEVNNGITLCGLCHIAAHTTRRAYQKKYAFCEDEEQ